VCICKSPSIAWVVVDALYKSNSCASEFSIVNLSNKTFIIKYISEVNCSRSVLHRARGDKNLTLGLSRRHGLDNAQRVDYQKHLVETATAIGTPVWRDEDNGVRKVVYLWVVNTGIMPGRQ
jgi:hypothetical protein